MIMLKYPTPKIPGSCVFVTLYGKRDLADMTKVAVLEIGRFMHYPGLGKSNNIRFKAKSHLKPRVRKMS